MKYQWRIFLVSLDPIKGSEQAGRRPVLVISREEINQLLPVVNVIPLTSRKSPERTIYPNEVLLLAGTGGLRADSIALRPYNLKDNALCGPVVRTPPGVLKRNARTCG